MRIVVTFLLNAGLNFAVGLVIASLLGPTSYGHYAVWASTGALLATGLFDWLRLSTARFYGDAQQQAAPALRPTLDATYMVFIALLVGGGVVAVALPALGLTAALVGAVVFTAVANGAFDFRTALARARFRDRDYAVLVIGKGVLGLACAAAAALMTHEPVVVLAAQAGGTLLATLPVRGSLADRNRVKPAPQLVRRFAIYGLPVVAANVVFQSILLMNRSAAAATFGFAAAGHLSLATDVELRILLSVGAAVDVLLFQLAVRSESVGGQQAAAAQVRANIVHVTAVLLLLTIGFAATLPAFVALVVPTHFQDGFAPLALVILPGMTLFGLGQFAINPVFQMAHRTAPVIAGALLSAAVDALGLALMPASAGPLGIAAIHSISLGLGVVLLTGLALKNPLVRPSLRDVLGLLAASVVTAAALWPLRALPSPMLLLAAAALVGPSTYGAMLLLVDVGDVRRLALALYTRYRPRLAREGLA